MLRVKLAEIMGKRKLSNFSELARLVNLNRLTIKALYDESAKGIQFETLSKLCSVLDCQIQDLLEYVPEPE